MAELIPETLQKKIADRLHFYEDLGIRQFYRNRGTEMFSSAEQQSGLSEAGASSHVIFHEEPTLPKPARKPELQKPATTGNGGAILGAACVAIGAGFCNSGLRAGFGKIGSS